MAKLTHDKSGRTVEVPEHKVEYFTEKGWRPVDEKSASDSTDVVIPEGAPSEDWTNAQLDALAERDSIDLSGSKGNKAERLAAIAKHRAAAAAGE